MLAVPQLPYYNSIMKISSFEYSRKWQNNGDSHGSSCGMAFDQHDISALGHFCWVVPENCLTGDEMFAHLYGFSLEQVLKGVTAEEVIGRIVPGDRERVALETHSAILTGAAGSINYTAFDGSKYRQLGSIGRCLRDIDGVPSFYTGTVFERPDQRASLPVEFSGNNVVPLRNAHRSNGPKA